MVAIFFPLSSEFADVIRWEQLPASRCRTVVARPKFSAQPTTHVDPSAELLIDFLRPKRKNQVPPSPRSNKIQLATAEFDVNRSVELFL
jgi:hypothetical protein